VSCKSYTHVDTDALNHTVRTVTTDGLKEMIYEKTFSADDNYVIEEADENGIEVSYNYANPKNGLITSSEDSYGTTTYAYDAMGRLAEIKTAVSGLSNGATHIKNEYSDPNDRISSITHNGFTYNFLYNDYGDYYIVKVGSQNLVTYGYNNQLVNSITYGNNDALYFTYSGENITEIKDTQHNTIYQYDYDSDGNLNKIIDNKSGLTTEFGVTKYIDHATYFISRKVDEMNQANAAYVAENGNSSPENLPYSSNDFNNVSLDDLYCEEIVYRTDNPRDIRYAIVVEDEGTYEYFAEDEFYNYNSETSYNPQTGVSINSKKTKIDYNWESITTAYSQDVFGRMINTEDMQEKIGADVYDDMSAAQIVVERNNENLPKSINKTNFYYNDSISTVHPQITGLSSDITVTNNLYDANFILKKYDDIDNYWSEFEDYEFEYDNSNRLVRAYLQNGNIIQEDVRYTYNSNNLIIREDHYYSYNSSFSYTFSYGNSGKINGYSVYAYTLSTLGDPLSEYLVIYLNENDTYYSAAKNTWHYKYEYSYDFDNNGNIIAVYDGLDETTRVLLARYNYDSAGQLIREDNSIDNKSYTYMYDAGGNIAQKCEYTYSLNSLGTATKTITYSYDSTWKDKMTGYNGKPLTYDLIGNPTAYGSANNNGDEYRVYSWNGKKLESCSIFNCNNTPGEGYEYVYEYDYEGNVCKITSYEYNWLNGVYTSDYSHPRVTEYTWKSGNLVYQCLNPQTISSSQPVDYYPGNLEQNSDLTIRYLYDDNNEPYGFITEGTKLFYYQKNLQGDITGVIQPSSQKCFLNYSYDAFGNMSYEMNYSGVTELLAAMSLLNNQVLAYRGYMYDLITGMYYLHSRFYVPEWGRFLNADSYLDTGNSVIGTNVFAYCNNNPVNGIDPTGEYNSALAKSYAQKWWNGYNPVYKQNTNDCANFVSQCLYAGKLSKMTGLLSSGWHHWKIQIPVYSSNPLIGAYISGTKYVWQISDAWGKAPALKSWLDKSNYVSKVITINKANEIKDKIKTLSANHCMAVIFFRHNGKYSHSAISGIVDKENGNVYYYSHTNSRNGNSTSGGILDAINNPNYDRILIYVLKS
jgi:RHS repeat-associated protein